MKILVTGGAGYIGSHTSVILLEQGHEVVIADNLCNSKRVAVDRVEELTGKKVTFYQYDVCDEEKMREIFSKEKIDAVIHFAGLKAVGESVSIPLKYYDNNLTSTLVLLKVMCLAPLPLCTATLLPYPSGRISPCPPPILMAPQS